MKDDQRIEDVYVHIMEDLKSFIDKEDLPESFVKLFNKFIDRKLVKSIFMPIIYGKTQMSTAEDIKMALKPYFYPAFKESFCWPPLLQVLEGILHGNGEFDTFDPPCRLVCFNL